MMKIKKALFMGVVWLSALVCSPIFVHAEEVEDVQTVSGCEIVAETPTSTDDTSEANNASINQIVLDIPSDVSFLFKNGRVFTVTDSESDIKGSLENSIWFKTENNGEIFPDEFSWDSFNVTIGSAGHYYATVTLTFSNNDVQYILPDNTYTFSIPVHIQDSNLLEIYLDSIWSALWGTSFSGSVYIPSDIEVTDEDLSAWYCYCGTDKPSVSTLDSLTFSEDTSTLFFYVDYYDGNSGTIGIDFSELPSEDGWYAFYTEAGDLHSNYILIDSRDLTGDITYYKGTRSGDSNSDFPTIDGDTNEDESSSDGDSESDNAENNAASTVNEAVEASAPANTNVSETVDSSTKTDSDSSLKEQENTIGTTGSLKEQDSADSTTVSGKRICALIDSGSAFIVSKNNVTTYFSPESLQALDMKDTDFFSVTLTWSKSDTFCLEVMLNGTELDTLPEVLISFQDILYDSDRKQTVTDALGNVLICQDSNGRLAFTASSVGEYTVSDEPSQKPKTEAAPKKQPANADSITDSDASKVPVYIVIATISTTAALSGAGAFLWYWRKWK